MEAKLNSMAQRKPADEDYVPGQGAYRTEDDSGSPSPAPEGALEDELGLDEGGRAADDLQREMMEELGFTIDTKPEMVDEKPNVEESKVEEPATTPLDNPSLPPRPLPPATASVENRSMTKDEVFKKGLAGLPKKPVF
jgi:hypothetical protein